jgi:hypothetical protein
MKNQTQSGEIDSILLAEDALPPSSGFAASVLDAIREQAAQPAPIAFPWRLAIPGFTALLIGITALEATAIRNMNRPSGTDWLLWLYSNAGSSVVLRTQVAPVLLALAASWLCVLLCGRVATGFAGWFSR